MTFDALELPVESHPVCMTGGEAIELTVHVFELSVLPHLVRATTSGEALA